MARVGGSWASPHTAQGTGQRPWRTCRSGRQTGVPQPESNARVWPGMRTAAAADCAAAAAAALEARGPRRDPTVPSRRWASLGRSRSARRVGPPRPDNAPAGLGRLTARPGVAAPPRAPTPVPPRRRRAHGMRDSAASRPAVPGQGKAAAAIAGRAHGDPGPQYLRNQGQQRLLHRARSDLQSRVEGEARRVAGVDSSRTAAARDRRSGHSAPPVVQPARRTSAGPPTSPPVACRLAAPRPHP